MKNTKKTVYLCLALLAPVFLILFFTIFASSRHKLPVFFAYDSIETERGYVITDAHTIPAYKLIDQTGAEFNSTNYDSCFKVYDFIFTRCGSICPDMTTQLIRVQEAFKNDKDIVLISLSVDPEHDTSQVLQHYATKYNAIPGKWFFLTGAKDSIYTLGQREFFLTAKQNEEDLTDFLHSDKVVLVDKKGWIRGYYDGTEEKDVDRLITELKVLQKIERDAKR
ncbi:MAG: SCO family protein [Cytophaga sp.]|uniref:SCO family protein n=1 Tax=Cytophaga sp. TaxID=29535 RepID=UPI003F7D491E